jgi:flagellar protein FliJ
VPRFVFQLEGLLRHRRRAERERQRDLALAQREARQLENELRQLGNSMSATTNELRTRLTGRLDLAFLAAHRRYIVTMQIKGQNILQKLSAMAPQIESRRLTLVAAARDRKAIEKLKERRKEIWLADQAKREMADLDEVSNQMYFAEAETEKVETRVES